FVVTGDQTGNFPQIRRVELRFAPHRHGTGVDHLAQQVLALQNFRLIGDVDGRGGGVSLGLRASAVVRRHRRLNSIVLDQNLEIRFIGKAEQENHYQGGKSAPQKSSAHQITMAKSDRQKLFYGRRDGSRSLVSASVDVRAVLMHIFLLRDLTTSRLDGPEIQPEQVVGDEGLV